MEVGISMGRSDANDELKFANSCGDIGRGRLWVQWVFFGILLVEFVIKDAIRRDWGGVSFTLISFLMVGSIWTYEKRRYLAAPTVFGADAIRKGARRVLYKNIRFVKRHKFGVGVLAERYGDAEYLYLGPDGETVSREILKRAPAAQVLN